VIEDIRQMAVAFSSCEFGHVYHSQNVGAHILARSCATSLSAVWHSVPPDVIREVICNDSLVI
jgi:hypothetical protein